MWYLISFHLGGNRLFTLIGNISTRLSVNLSQYMYINDKMIIHTGGNLVYLTLYLPSQSWYRKPFRLAARKPIHGLLRADSIGPIQKHPGI